MNEVFYLKKFDSILNAFCIDIQRTWNKSCYRECFI